MTKKKMKTKSDDEPVTQETNAEQEATAETAEQEKPVDTAEAQAEEVAEENGDVASEEASAEEAVIAEEDASEALKEQLAETEDRLLRLQAEFDNFRRRTVREKDDLRQTANADLLASLLPVLDNFDRALAHAEDSPILEGIVMVQKQFWDILNREGLEKAGAEGEVFDPKFHDAVMQEPQEGTEPGIILQVLQPGYKYKDRLLRAAMVKVSQ